jgi:hypothetical protein
MTSIKNAMLASAALVLTLAACSTWKANPEMNYYHGPNVPEGYISILRASPSEITFEIHVKFPDKKMYHLVLEGNAPVAEGWYTVDQRGDVKYTVTMKPKEGRLFEPGVTYRLCIGRQNPEAIQMTSSNYQCLVDYTFVFENKTSIMPL